MRKAGYSLKTADPELPVEKFIRQPIRVQFPRMSYNTDRDHTEFSDFIDYYNQFYNGCRQYLPAERTIWVRYIDFFENPMSCVLKWSHHFPVRTSAKNFQRNEKAQNQIKEVVKRVFVQPTKRHGTPQHGGSAKEWYRKCNLSKLFSQETYDWINGRLDTELMNHIGYKTRDLIPPQIPRSKLPYRQK